MLDYSNNQLGEKNKMETIETFKFVENIKKGEYVKRSREAQKTYIRGEYDRATKRYSLTDTSDHCREIFVKSGTLLFVGFEY
jgi:hypothetical protein